MSANVLTFSPLEAGAVRTVLCDADGNLFPSEEPAFVASCEVTNRLLADLGVDRRYTPEELRGVAMGKNFRATALDLATTFGVALDDAELERRVAEEKREVSAHLARVLEPDRRVLEPMQALAGRFGLAAVSSSAVSRLAACFDATGLATLFPPHLRFSAEDSLPVPTSKPDPAIYLLAGERLGVAGPDALAVEDSVPGVRSAVAAGFQCVGNVMFVGEPERSERIRALREAGASAVVFDWWQLVELLGEARRSSAGGATARSSAR